MNNNVVSLQIDTAGIMAMNRVDRIVLDPIRTNVRMYPYSPYGCAGHSMATKLPASDPVSISTWTSFLGWLGCDT